jgi:hypothetical protein
MSGAEQFKPAVPERISKGWRGGRERSGARWGRAAWQVKCIEAYDIGLVASSHGRSPRQQIRKIQARLWC